MLIKKVEFVISSPSWKDCPEPNLPEYAFIGRSNVGKSSLINCIVNKKGLAKTSSTPGKTKLINHFIVNDQWYLTDLPGYGYAKVSKKERNEFSKLNTEYIKNRKNLVNLYVLVDGRHEPMKNDVDFILWLGEHQVPFTIVFTKVDKIGRDKFNFNYKAYCKRLRENWDDLPPMIITSATEKIGKDELLSHISDINIMLEKDNITF